MKIKEIEFGVTVNLGNYESCKLSLRIELEDWEDPTETLAALQKKVIELSGAKPSLLNKLPTYKNNWEVLRELEDAQQLYRDKRKQLDKLVLEIERLEARVKGAEELVETLEYFNYQNITISELEQMIEKIKLMKGYQHKLEDQIDDKGGYDSDDSSMF